MVPKRGFFQPVDIAGQIGWMWWFILFMMGLVMWSEASFKIEIIPMMYIAVVIVIGCVTIIRRRIYIAGSQLFLGRVFVSEYEKISLMSIDNWQLKGQVLSFERAGRSRKYWLSKNIANQIKEYMNTNDGKDNI